MPLTLPFASLDTIGDWWSLLIVRDALRGVRRLANSENLAKNMLAGRLKMLVDEGILRLQPASDSARQGCPDRWAVLQAVRPTQWADDYLFDLTNW